jgi:hypothetical protein
LFNFFEPPKPTPKAAPKPTPKVASKPETKAVDISFNFFGNPAKKTPKSSSVPSTPKVVSKSAPKAAPKAEAKSKSTPVLTSLEILLQGQTRNPLHFLRRRNQC